MRNGTLANGPTGRPDLRVGLSVDGDDDRVELAVDLLGPLAGERQQFLRRLPWRRPARLQAGRIVAHVLVEVHGPEPNCHQRVVVPSRPPLRRSAPPGLRAPTRRRDRGAHRRRTRCPTGRRSLSRTVRWGRFCPIEMPPTTIRWRARRRWGRPSVPSCRPVPRRGLEGSSDSVTGTMPTQSSPSTSASSVLNTARRRPQRRPRPPVRRTPLADRARIHGPRRPRPLRAAR